MPRLLLAVIASMLMVSGCSQIPNDSPSAKWFADDVDVTLATAVRTGDTAAIAELVAGGANPNAAGVEGLTMLQWSIMSDSLDGMTGLLEAGADPDLEGRGGGTPLGGAAFDGGLPFVEALLSAGANPDIRDAGSGLTPLQHACRQRDHAVFTALLNAGADPDVATSNADGAIHTCARTNAGDSLLLMLERGADPLARTSGGASFQDYYFSYPRNVLNQASLDQRLAIIAWLEAHDIPVVPEAFN